MKKSNPPCSSDGENDNSSKRNYCKECGITCKKPSLLRQHMLSHTSEKPYKCTVSDCTSSYKRKDHLTRHLHTHSGKLLNCPYSECKITFTYKESVHRHVKRFHSESRPQFPCECGKVFRTLPKLKKHEKIHVEMKSVEAMCAEPGCFQYFSNQSCLKEHIKSSHGFVVCDVCHKKRPRKDIKRHMRTHFEERKPKPRINCDFEGCGLSFSSEANMNTHKKAAHLLLKPFACGFSGCDKRFAFKHVRDRHEKSGVHVFVPVRTVLLCYFEMFIIAKRRVFKCDFEEMDAELRSRQRRSRKRQLPDVETMLRKRVMLSPVSSQKYA